MKITTTLIPLVFVAALHGCGGGASSPAPAPAPTPISAPPVAPLPPVVPPAPVVLSGIFAASGDNQTIPLFAPLPFPLQVVVTDAAGRAVSGVEVEFSAQEGKGANTPTLVLTSNDGRGTWAPGAFTVPGNHTITATAVNYGSVNFTVTVPAPRVPAAIAMASGDNQTIPAFRTIPQPLQVVITDAGGRGVQGAKVEFSAQEGRGANTPTSVITDFNGRGTWMPGYFMVEGTHLVSATVANIGSINFLVIVTPSLHLYDGPYKCTYPTKSPTYTSYTFEIRENKWNSFQHMWEGGSFNAATGEFGAVIGNDAYRRHFEGVLVVDGNGKATGSGYYKATSHLVQGNLVEAGELTCIRG